MTEPFRIAFVAGVSPDKWASRWREREPDPLELALVPDDEQVAVLADGRAHMAFARLPVDTGVLHAIPLYVEVAVAVVPKEHPAAAYDELALADLADEQLIQDPAEVPGWEALPHPPRLDFPPMGLKDAVEVVASGTGILVLPMSVARLHHRKDVTAVPLTDGPESRVALVWRKDLDDPRTDTFVGIVRGRTANSSRTAEARPAPARKQAPKPASKPAQKTARKPAKKAAQKRSQGKKRR